MAPIKLLLVTHSLSGGGAERFSSILATHLDRARFAPSIAAATARRSYALPEDVAVSTLGYRGLLTLPRTVRRLRELILATRPDVVLSNVLSTNGLAGWALRGVRSPVAWVARIGNAPGISESTLQRRAVRRAYPRAAALVCNSEGARAAFARCYPELAGLAEHLPNPTDCAHLDRLAGEPAAIGGVAPTLLWVGRLVRQKRPDLLIDAFSRVHPQIPCRLVVCGDGPLRRAAERRARERGVEREVEFRGFVDNPFALMRRSDLFVMTSDFEGLPNALIEAQVLGLAAVATRAPHGVDEVVADRSTGRLVPIGDDAALAGEIVALLRDPEGRRAMGEAARQRARRLFGLDTVLPRWSALLERVAAAGRR